MRCENCGQALPEIRLGVRLTALKARLFDLVRRSGVDGIHSDDLHSLLYPDGGGSRHTLKAHIWQINELIADEGYRIDGRGSFYRLINIRKRAISKIPSISSIGSSNLTTSSTNPEAQRR
jgi:hypothetical protein